MSRPPTIVLGPSRPIPRRGLSRVEAAMYLGISPSKFDGMRKDGRICWTKSLTRYRTKTTTKLKTGRRLYEGFSIGNHAQKTPARLC
jgi:hypothetical protein